MYDFKQQAQDRQGAVQPHKLDYYYHRIAELGLSEPEAQRAGIWPDRKTGDILLYAKRYDGKTRNIQPKGERRQRPFTVRRVHPDRLKAGGAKYVSEKDRTPVAYPSPLAIKNYQQQITGGQVAFIEGYFKALALSRAGVESVAFGGISLYKLDFETRQYLTARRPDTVLVMYDGDALDVRRDKTSGQITDKRTRDFLTSAERFTGQLINHFANIGHKCKIIWCAVNPDHPEKGADDLLAAATGPAEVVKQLATFRDGKNWIFEKLPATNKIRERKLKRRFALTDAQTFYRANAAEIGQDTFTYRGLQFRAIAGHVVMISDTYDVPLAIIPLHVDTYLDDELPALDKLLATRKKLAIQSDTGTGKTTYLIEWAKRHDHRLVIVVPTRSQARQLAADHPTVTAIYGSNTTDRAADAAAAQIVAATYDTLHHLPDLADRALVIDEAHNLVNQYGQVRNKVVEFRARTLTRLQQLAEIAKQVVYLSGTMPKALLKAYDVPLVDVIRTNSPTVRLHRLTARNSKINAHTATLASQLARDLKADPHQVHFALLNNTKELKKLRKLLTASGYLQKNQIEVITRTTYNAGETSALDDLVERSEIRPGVRLVLCTCIISEGVNIKNTNVGKVYAVGVKCPDTIRQFVARFRHMATVDLYLILPPEAEPGVDFSIPTADYIEHLTAQAEASAKLASKMLAEAGLAEDYTRSNMFPYIMPNEAGDGFTVDRLAILASERDRMLATAPTSYTIGRLLAYDGFIMAAAEQTADSDEVVAALDVADKAIKATRDAHLANIEAELLTAPENALAALKTHYQRKGDRNTAKRLDILAGDIIAAVNELDVLTWLDRHEAALDFKEVRELIRRAGQLHFAGVQQTATWLALPARDWRKKWQQIQTTFGLQVLEQRPRNLPPLLRLDLMAKRAIVAALDGLLDGTDNTITDVQLAEVVRDTIGRADKRKGMHRAPCLTKITKGRAVQIIEELYQVDITRHGTKKMLTIGAKFGQLPPGVGIVATCTALTLNPLKIKDLLGEN